jgi:hypothetical protein
LTLLRTDTFEATDESVQMYIPPSGTTLLHVKLWGAGGGGGGATSAPTLGVNEVSVGSGGGAGAYAEGYFTTILGSYPFQLAVGGAGGIGVNGNSANPSFFSSVGELQASGGQMGLTSVSGTAVSVSGGLGGTATGSAASATVTGGAGTAGYGSALTNGTICWVSAGHGGMAGSGSGISKRATITGFISALNGEDVLSFGGGGSGGVSLSGSTTGSGSVGSGSDGANSHMIVFAYGL